MVATTMQLLKFTKIKFTSFFIKHSSGSCKRSIRLGLQNSCSDSSYQLICHFCGESNSWGFYSAIFPDMTSLWLLFPNNWCWTISYSCAYMNNSPPFMCLYVSSMFSLVMGLTKLFPKLYIPFFLDEFSVLLCIICINEHMYELTFFSWFANIFYNCNFLFIMLTVSSEEFTFLILMKLNLQFFLLQIMPLALSKISLKTKYHRDFPLCSFLDLLNF